MAASNKQATIPRCDAPRTTSSCKLTANGNQDRPGESRESEDGSDENGGQKKRIKKEQRAGSGAYPV